MKIVKRNGSEVTFDVNKIVSAIERANITVPLEQRLTHEQVVDAGDAVEAEAAKCNDRNRRRYRGLVDAGKKANVAKTAVASELVRQMWAIGLVVAREQAAGR